MKKKKQTPVFSSRLPSLASTSQTLCVSSSPDGCASQTQEDSGRRSIWRRLFFRTFLPVEMTHPISSSSSSSSCKSIKHSTETPSTLKAPSLQNAVCCVANERRARPVAPPLLPFVLRTSTPPPPSPSSRVLRQVIVTVFFLFAQSVL